MFLYLLEGGGYFSKEIFSFKAPVNSMKSAFPKVTKIHFRRNWIVLKFGRAYKTAHFQTIFTFLTFWFPKLWSSAISRIFQNILNFWAIFTICKKNHLTLIWIIKRCFLRSYLNNKSKIRRVYHIQTGDDFHHFYKKIVRGSKYQYLQYCWF